MLVPVQIPLPLDHALFSFPKLQKDGGPKAHEYGKKNGGGVVKHVSQPSELATFDQPLILARFVAQRAQGDVARAVGVADLPCWNVVWAVDGQKSIDETEKADDGRGKEHLGVEAEPAKI